MRQQLGIAVFRVLHPGRAAAGEEGQLLPLFHPFHELGGLLHDGEIRPHHRVVNLLEPHVVQGRHQLAHDVLPLREAKGVAQPHPHSRGNLHHHFLPGIIEVGAEPVAVALDGDGPRGADGGALAAAHALRLADGLVKGGGDVHVGATEGEVYDADILHL